MYKIMNKIRENKSSKTQKGNEFEPRRKDNSEREKSPIWPEEYEEQRSMNIRMKEQPLQSTKKPEKKTKK